jgi:hypothetical protein
MRVRLIKKDSQLFGRSAFFECPVYYYQVKKYGIWWTAGHRLDIDIGPDQKLFKTPQDYFKFKVEQTFQEIAHNERRAKVPLLGSKEVLFEEDI